MPRTPLFIDASPEERDWAHQAAQYLGVSTSGMVRLAIALAVPELLARVGVRWNRVAKRWEEFPTPSEPPKPMFDPDASAGVDLSDIVGSEKPAPPSEPYDANKIYWPKTGF